MERCLAPVNVFPVPHPHDGYDEAVVLDHVEYPVTALPETVLLRA